MVNNGGRAWGHAVLCASLLGSPVGADAALRIWPSDCGGTANLQACIHFANSGDEVRIDTEAVIDEDLAINKSLRLFARGKSARFAPGRNLTLTATGSATTITLENLWLSGRISGSIGSANAADSQAITLRGLRLTPASVDGAPTIGLSTPFGTLSTHSVTVAQSHVLEPPTTTGGVVRYAVSLFSIYGGSAHLSLQENQIMAASAGVLLDVEGPDADLVVRRNRIGRFRPWTTRHTGLLVSMASAAAGSMARVQLNQIFGYFVGTQVITRNGGGELALANNTIVRNENGVVLTRQGSAALTGRIANNILAFNRACGLDYQATVPTATADYNLYHGNLANRCSGAPTGANDRSGDPRFVGTYDFRLTLASPAVDQGNNLDQPLTSLTIPIPLPDYDHRSGRTFGTVDIGAHEFSADASFVHHSTAANTSGNLTTISPPPFALFSSDALQLSSFGRLATAPSLPAAADAHLGLWWDSSAWTIFRQSTGFGPPMPTGRVFHVLLDLDANTSYVHSAAAGNTSANTTTLDRSGLNGIPTALPIVSQRYNPNNVYNDSSIGVWYDGSRWRVFNQAPVGGLAPAMPVGASFNVLVPDAIFAAGHHAFRSELGVAVGSHFLDHPLLNDSPCAHPYVSASYNPNNVYVPSALLFGRNIRADDGRAAWFIERGDGVQIPAGAAFHVYVDPQQSRRCREELIYADSLE